MSETKPTAAAIRAAREMKWEIGSGASVEMIAREIDKVAGLPELLEALELMMQPAHKDGCLWVLSTKNPCQCGSWLRVNGAVQKARAAIAKARGGA